MIPRRMMQKAQQTAKALTERLSSALAYRADKSVPEVIGEIKPASTPAEDNVNRLSKDGE